MRAAAGLRGSRVALRPIEVADYPALRRAELSDELALRWRHHGRHDPPEAFGASLWLDSLFHFLAYDIRTSDIIGIVSSYSPYWEGGSCYLAAARIGDQSRMGSKMVGAVALAIDYIFNGWPIRKIYFETAEYNFVQFDGAVGRFLEEEGRLREHVFLNGRYWDQIILALWRSTWTSQGYVARRFA